MDDHPAVLSGLSTMLAHEFDVAGVAAGGHQALEMARRVAPDAIVLDINMPGLNGFQTLEALDRDGSRAPVVFLSMMGGDEFVSEAFRCGGRGYVVKSRAACDLSSALDHVLDGRLFLPTLTSMADVMHGPGHAMIVQNGPEAALDALANVLHRALAHGEAVSVIATPEVRGGLASRLSARGVDMLAPPDRSRYLVVDAAEAIGRFLVDGRPDSARLKAIASEVEQFRRTAGARRVTIFGNMVELLHASDNPYAALELEHQWNAVVADLPFFTICGYALSRFHDCSPEIWAGACAAHKGISHSNDF